MGRYYFGDIEGKFAFAMQPSDAADRFGVFGGQSTLSYYFDEDNLHDVEEELRSIIMNLGDKFFHARKAFHGFSNYEEQEKFGVTRSQMRELYDLNLGLKIRRCIKLNGSCNFEAEL